MSPRPLVLLLALAPLACSDDDARSSTGFSGPGGSGITSITGATGITGASTSGATDPSTSDTTDTSGATGEPTTGGPDDSGGSVPNPDGLPNGAECTANQECMTGNCYKIQLPVDGLPPGICSPCDQDIDCMAAGTGTSCTLDIDTLGGKCTDGGLGSFCETQAACQPHLFCEPIVDGAEGLLPLTCSECRTDADCAAPRRCVSSIDTTAFTGKRTCVAPGTIANDGICPVENGDAMCLSGICALFDVEGLLQIGVCSQCDGDDDCIALGLTTCLPPKFSSGLVGRKCA
ncbi:MAG TPA: hypothetical protein VIK91_21090 [Nannocystis sp.]